MKPIDPKITPTERTYNNLRKWGAIPEFVDWELPNFIEYFVETGGKKKAWQTCLQRWMRTAWEGKAGRQWERERHFRKDTGSNGDIFEKVFNNMQKSGEIVVDQVNVAKDGYPPNIMTRIRIPERPSIEIDPNLKTEDYLDQLGRMFK